MNTSHVAIKATENLLLSSLIKVKCILFYSGNYKLKMSEKKVHKRKKFDISFKLDAITRVKNGEKQCVVCKDLGINEATLRGWIRAEASLKQATLQLDESEGLARKRLRLANDADLDQSLYHWFVQERANGAPISGPIVCWKASHLDKEINGESSTFKVQGK